MRAILCLSGPDCRQFVRRSLSLLPLLTIDLALLHVMDTRPEEEMGYARRPWLRPGRAHGAQVADAEDEAAAETLDEARLACLDAGVAASDLRAIARRGHPQHVIVEVARAEAANLVVVGARHHGAALTGPKSVGPVARFVLDHAPCDVLLLRRQAV